MERLRSVLRGQRGLTFVELLMGMSILSVAVIALGTLLPGIQRGSIRASRDDARARMALTQIDRQVRWASAVFDPSVAPDPVCPGCRAGYALAVYDEGAGTGAPRCSVWRLDEDGRLLTASFAPGAGPTWHVLATGLSNRSLAHPAFQTPGGGSRTVEITLAAGPASEPSWLHASVASRNTSVTRVPGVCGLRTAS